MSSRARNQQNVGMEGGQSDALVEAVHQAVQETLGTGAEPSAPGGGRSATRRRVARSGGRGGISPQQVRSMVAQEIERAQGQSNSSAVSGRGAGGNAGATGGTSGRQAGGRQPQSSVSPGDLRAMVAQEVRRVEQQGSYQGGQRAQGTGGNQGAARRTQGAGANQRGAQRARAGGGNPGGSRAAQGAGQPGKQGGQGGAGSRRGWAALRTGGSQGGAQNQNQAPGQRGGEGAGSQAPPGRPQGSQDGGQQPSRAASQSAQGVAEVLGQAQWQLSQELSANLKELRRVISQSQEIARKIEQVLGEGTSGQGQ